MRGEYSRMQRTFVFGPTGAFRRILYQEYSSNPGRRQWEGIPSSFSGPYLAAPAVGKKRRPKVIGYSWTSNAVLERFELHKYPLADPGFLSNQKCIDDVRQCFLRCNSNLAIANGKVLWTYYQKVEMESI